MVDRDDQRREDARSKRRRELETRIDMTDAGHEWLKRVNQIGKLERRVKMAKTRHRLSKHFVVEEFDCKDGTKVRPREYDGLEYLCRQFLEPMRRKYGPCTVHSGFRTKSHNDAVGGEKNSYHIYTIHDGNDQAVDVSFARGTSRQWHAMANAIRKRKRRGRGGLGLYRTFIHIDIRDVAANWRG